jgi:hypothetical protein
MVAGINSKTGHGEASVRRQNRGSFCFEGNFTDLFIGNKNNIQSTTYQTKEFILARVQH